MNQDDLEREYEEDANEPPHTATKVIGIAVMIITAVCAVAAFVMRLM